MSEHGGASEQAVAAASCWLEAAMRREEADKFVAVSAPSAGSEPAR